MLASGVKLGLSDAGSVVNWVGSAERAEEVLRSESFDAAIIDIDLPQIDGLELTLRLRARGLGMPVLILTARDALHDRFRGSTLVPTTTRSNPSSCLSWWAARQTPSHVRYTRSAWHTRDPGFQEV
jgi:CheY-like chemotaxis protein